MKTLTIQQQDFKQGLHVLEDDSKAPLGSAREMINCIITDRGGIAPRPGTLLMGTYNTSALPVRGLFNFRKSKSQSDILVKFYDTNMQYYHPTLLLWDLLKTGFTSDQEFDYAYSLVNTDNDDFMYFNNRFEEYQRWSGAHTQLNGALVGGETDVVVDSVLQDPVYYSSTATSNSATSVTVSTAAYSTDMWKGFYIYFPGTGKVRLISANTGTVITFATLGSGPGNVAFQIRQLAFPLASITASTIAFVDSNPDTITDSGNQFLIAGFKAGQKIVVTGTANNNKTFTIASVVAGTITLVATDSVTAEGAGSPFTIKLLDQQIIYNSTVLAYTNIDVATKFAVVSATAASDNAPVALIPYTYISAPRGNRIDILKGRVYVGRVRSAVARDVAGNTQGSTQAGSVFVSKLLDPTDFSFAASRVAGEGDILNIAYGGGDVTDVVAFEDGVAIYKEDYIETVKYTQDTADTATRTPLKTGIGSVARVLKGSDDHYFMTPDKKYSSLGRVQLKDITPQSENLGYVIKRLLDTYNNDSFNGIEFNNRLISSHKSSDTAMYNDLMLVYNKKTKSFEGIWNLGANAFETFKDVNAFAPELVYGESNGANVWKMFQDIKADVRGTSNLPYQSSWQSNFFNVLPLKANLQAICSLAVEGYISGNTTFTFNLFKDFETSPTVTFTFGGTETQFLQGAADIGPFFGAHPFASQPIGSVSAPGSDGRSRFSFILYFPYIYAQYLSSQIASNGVNQDWEIIRCSYGLKEDISVRTSNTKSLSS